MGQTPKQSNVHRQCANPSCTSPTALDMLHLIIKPANTDDDEVYFCTPSHAAQVVEDEGLTGTIIIHAPQEGIDPHDVLAVNHPDTPRGLRNPSRVEFHGHEVEEMVAILGTISEWTDDWNRIHNVNEANGYV